MINVFNHHDITRNEFILHGPLARQGYDWWWHSFTAQDAETREMPVYFARSDEKEKYDIFYDFATSGIDYAVDVYRGMTGSRTVRSNLTPTAA